MSWKRSLSAGVALVACCAGLAACGGGSAHGPVNLSWYVFSEPSGSFAAAAKACGQASGGRYTITMDLLPTNSDEARVGLVRRLAAHDSSIDIMALDVIRPPEFATAHWIRPVPAAFAQQIKAEDLPGPVQTATWDGRLVAVPINSNTELLWYRKDLLKAIGQPVPSTWQQMIADARMLAKKGKPHFIEEQGAEYEGLTVWFDSLDNSAGGQIVTGNDKVVINHAAEVAASTMHELATSPAADPSLNVDQEDQGRIAFEGGTAAFEINYPYVWPSAQKDVPKTIFPQMGYAAFPTVIPGRKPRVAIGGYDLGVSAYSRHPALDFDAIRCLTQEKYEITYAEKGGLAPVRGAIYDLPSFEKQYPFHALIKSQLENYGIRPQTPAYADVTLAIQKALSPTGSIDPATIVAKLRSELKAALSSESLL